MSSRPSRSSAAASNGSAEIQFGQGGEDEEEEVVVVPLTARGIACSLLAGVAAGCSLLVVVLLLP